MEQLTALIQAQHTTAKGGILPMAEAELASQRLVRLFDLLLTISQEPTHEPL